MDHLPAEVPSLMDDLPADYQAETHISALDGEAMSAVRLVAAEEQGSSEPAFHPADVGGPVADPTTAAPDASSPAAASPAAASPDAASPAASRRRILAIAGGGTAAALLAAVALTTPYLGVQLVDPLGLASEPAEPEPEPGPEPGPQAKAKAKAKADKSKTEAPPLEPEPAEPEQVELSTENVDTLAFAALRDSTAVLANEPDAGVADAQALLAWARFRLASRGDENALDALAATLPRRPQEISKMEELAAAAAVGGLALTGKLGPARRIGERLHKGRLKESAHLALALSTAYTRRPEQAKALRHVERARKLAPDHPDAALRRGMILLSGREPEAGVEALTALATEAGDPDLTVQVAGALLDAGHFGGVSRAVTRLEAAGQIDAVAPQRRDLAWRVLCYRTLRSGNLRRAAEIAGVRAKTDSELDLRIEHARLTAAAGGDGDALLNTQAEKLEGIEAARVLAERVRLALRAGDVEAAERVLGEKEKLGRKTGGWVKLAQGWIARHAGDADAARAAFHAAAKKRLAEARLEVALLSGDKPGPLIKKLTELERKTGLPAATYHLAKLMHARGNAGGAAERFERVLWTDPTVIDPLDLVLEWAKAAALAGEAERATTAVAAIRANRPEDLRPALALIELKRQAGAHAEVVALFRELVVARPDNSSLKVKLATALNRTGAHSEAQNLLEELFKQDKTTRTPEALMELARAWADREPYRARQLARESIDSKPTAEKYMLVGRLAIQREQIDEARKAFNKAIELNDSALDAYVALADIDLEARAFDKVVAGLQEVLRQEPSHSEAATMLADVLVELGKPREAIKRYEVVLAAKESEEVLMKVARLQLQRIGQLGPAIKTLRRALALNPKLAEAHFHLGMALKDQGQHQDAVTSLQKCLSLDPEGDWADEATRTLQDLGHL
jgi:tetratricopeptide (TPR) repeat protein